MAQPLSDTDRLIFLFDPLPPPSAHLPAASFLHRPARRRAKKFCDRDSRDDDDEVFAVGRLRADTVEDSSWSGLGRQSSASVGPRSAGAVGFRRTCAYSCPSTPASSFD